MRRLNFESLVEESEYRDREDLETYADLDVDDALDQGIAALEEYSQRLDLIDAEIATLALREGSEVVALESLSEELQELLTASSLESLGLEALGLEETVDGLSGFWTRLWQVYFLDFLRTFDWVVDLIKNSSKKLKKYRERISSIRYKFSRKKPTLDQDKQKASYVMMENYWFTDKGFVKQPFAQLKTEHDLSRYILEIWPSVVEKEMAGLGSLAKGANFSTPETLERSLIKPLEGKKHPVTLFDKRYLGGRPYMLNTGLALSGRKKPELTPLQALAQPRKVKLSTRLMGFTTNALVPHVIPDVVFSNVEIDRLLDEGDAFLDGSEKLFERSENMKRQIGALRTSLEKMVDHAKSTSDKAVKSDIRAVGGYAKTLIDAYWTPSLQMAKRNIELSKGIAYLAGRLVAYAK